MQEIESAAAGQILTPDHPSDVAKVLKSSSSVKSTAVMWLRETSIRSKLSAGWLPTIVQLMGLDARVHSLYLEDRRAVTRPPGLARARGLLLGHSLGERRSCK